MGDDQAVHGVLVHFHGSFAVAVVQVPYLYQVEVVPTDQRFVVVAYCDASHWRGIPKGEFAERFVQVPHFDGLVFTTAHQVVIRRPVLLLLVVVETEASYLVRVPEKLELGLLFSGQVPSIDAPDFDGIIIGASR